MKRTIRITETELRQIINKTVRLTLNEGLFDFFNRKQDIKDLSKYKIINSYFYNKFSKIVRLQDGKQNLIDKKGRLVSPNLWFDEVKNFYDREFAKVTLGGKQNLIDKKGNLVSPNLWFDKISYFFDNEFAKVILKGKQNFIDKKGNLKGEWKEIPKTTYSSDGYSGGYSYNSDSYDRLARAAGIRTFPRWCYHD